MTRYGQYGSAAFHGDVLIDSDIDVDGTANLDAMDIDGALQLDGTLTVGVDDTGYDVTLYGDTSGSYVQWDASDDRLEFAYSGISMGTLSSASQTGVHLTAAKNEVLEVYADDNNTTLENAVYSTVRSRTMLFKDCTGISLFGVRGQIKCADEIDFASGVYAPVQGYFETIDDTDIQSGAKFWGVDSSLESPTDGTVTVKSGGILGGLHAELTGSGEFVQDSGGILAGLYIDEQVTTGDWGYGVYVASGTYGLYVNHTGTRGLYVTTNTATADLGDGYGGAIEANFDTTGEQAGHIAAASAWINHNGTVAAGGNMVCARTDGIWVNAGGSGDLSNAIAVYGARMQLIDSGGSADYCGPFSINVSGDTTDGIFLLYNTNGANELGYTVDGSEDDSKIGAVPLFCDIGSGTQYWVWVYDGAS